MFTHFLVIAMHFIGLFVIMSQISLGFLIF